MSLSDWATAHPSLVVLAWPLVSALITAAFQRPSTGQILASAGGRHLVLSAWSKLLYACAALGIDSRAVTALLRNLLTPKPPTPPAPPPLPNPAQEMIPVLHSDPPPSNTNSGHFPTAARLATFAVVVLATLATGAVIACGASDVTAYSPTPAQELGVVSYGSAEESCVQTDASKAEKQACVTQVQCDHGRAEAGACDGGAK